MYSPPGLVIFVAVEGTCTFYKRLRSLYFKFYSLRLLTQTNVILRACEAAYRNALAILAVAASRELCCVITPCQSAGRRLPSLFAIMFLDTLYSKKWYDMPHIGCGIHSLQRSTISRIGRHSAGYNIGMHVLYKL